MPQQSTINHKWLLKEIYYDKATGKLFWCKWHRGRKSVSEPIGSVQPNGYLVVTIAGERQLVHRLVFFYVTGKWPIEIDHINRQRADNRWANLREVTRSLNHLNKPTPASNSSGFRGVKKTKSGRWSAQIVWLKKKYHLGTFDTFERAMFARLDMEHDIRENENES